MQTRDRQMRQRRRVREMRRVPWRDLLKLTAGERIHELLLSLPWLLATLALLHAGWYPVALVTVVFFFLTGLRQVHNACHFMLGVPRWACDVFLFVMSVLMLSAMHAVQVTHMHHHRHCLDDDDIEAATAKMSAWRAILFGPLHPIRLHIHGFQLGSFSKKCWIVAELAAMAVALGLVLLSDSPTLKLFAALMLMGECLTGFFAVWTVHHDCEHTDIARTQRGWWKNLVSYNMFFHREHHLFPAVPTCHLPELARRLDRVVPDLRQQSVF